MDNKKDWLDEMLSDNSEHDAETLEKISDNCKALSGEQKNRILDMIREKEAGEKEYAGTDAAEKGNDENVLSIVDYQKKRTNIIKLFTGLAACICVVAGIKMLSDSNKLFIPSGDDSEKTTTVSETGMITENTGDEVISEKAVSATKVSITVTDETSHTEQTKPVTEAEDESVTEIPETAVTDSKVTEIPAENTADPASAEPFVSVSGKAEVTTEPEKTDEWEFVKIYGEVLDSLRYYAPQFNVTYIVYDMNHDGVNELAVVTEKNTDDQKIRFYTINNHEAVELAVIPTGQNVKFRKDGNSGNLCVECTSDGTGSVVSYSFDGNAVSEADALRDYNYEAYPEFLEAANEQFSLSNVTYGKADNGYNSYVIMENGGEEMINSQKYYFTD